MNDFGYEGRSPEEIKEEKLELARLIKIQMDREYDDEYDDAFVPNRLKFETRHEEKYMSSEESDNNQEKT